MKAMIFTISQMEKFHGFGQVVVELECKDKTLENVYEFKLLQITTDKNLNWKKHINNTTKNTPEDKRRYTPLPVRKQLAESLILLKLDYCNELLFEIP